MSTDTASLRSILSDASDVLVVNPSQDVIETIATGADLGDGEMPETRVVADKRPLSKTMEDYLVAGKAADLIEEEILTFRTAEDLPNTTALVTDDCVYALLEMGDQRVALAADEADVVEGSSAHYDECWERAEGYTLRVPGRSQVETALTDMSEGTEQDFEAVLDSLETARGDGEGLDEVTVTLLVAAKNSELLYDVSKMGENLGLASKATFSRTKSKLEDLGLIETEKVPIDVGRPRQRLHLADDRLRGASASELANVAQTLIS